MRGKFRTWRRSRPFWAGLWTLLGALIIIAFPLRVVRLMFIAGNVVWLAVFVGVLIAICGLFLWIEPGFRRLLSALILVLALVSLVTSDLGGFLIGMLLALIGGSMGLAWTPVREKVPATPASVEAVGDPLASSST